MSGSDLRPNRSLAAPILIVEEDGATAALLRDALGPLGHPVHTAATAADAGREIARQTPALIVLDLVLPDADGRYLLASWRSAPATAVVPVVVVSVGSPHEVGNQCLALGASEFRQKPVDPAAFAAMAKRLLADGERRADAELDPLTGVAGPASLRRAYAQLVAGGPENRPLSVAMIDVDRFRAVNESCGKPTGDTVLAGVAGMIRASSAAGQIVGRWRGDQFLALLPGVTQQEAASWLERCLEAVEEHEFSSTQGATFTVTFSGGVVEVEPEATLEDAISAALGKLYLAKDGGRARVVTAAADIDVPETDILIADDDPIVGAIVRNTLEARGFRVEHHVDGRSALAAARQHPIDLFLLDVNMPHMDGFELLGALRSEPQYARAPVAMLTSLGDEESIRRATELGADDYLVKPVSSYELVAHVHQLLTRWVHGRLQELQGSGLYMRGIELLHQVLQRARDGEPLPVKDLSVLTLRIVDDLDKQPARLLGQVMNPTVFDEDYLAQHSLNAAILAGAVGQDVGVTGDDLDWLCAAALLHELGCTRLPEGLLQKSGDLTDEERRLLEQRPELSHTIINDLAPDYADAAEIALQVHERPDGSGYPRGLRGDQIMLEAQILGAVEVFEALTHNRPYRDRPHAASEAVKYLLESGEAQFRDRVLKALITKIGLYPVGSYVALSTGETALVLEHRESNPMRPLLAVMTDRTGRPLPAPRVTDPMLNPQINIRSSVPPPQIRPGTPGMPTA